MNILTQIKEPNNKADRFGFALIEIIVAIFIIGIMIGIVVPRFFNTKSLDLQKFTSKLNRLMKNGVQAAMQEGDSYKILFDFKFNRILLNSVKNNKLKDKMDLPKNISLVDLFINAKAELGKEEAWVFISPDGTSQEFIMNILDSNNKLGNYALVLNPFNAQFRLYDRYQKP